MICHYQTHYILFLLVGVLLSKIVKYHVSCYFLLIIIAFLWAQYLTLLCLSSDGTVRKSEPYFVLSASSTRVADGVITGICILFMNLATEGAVALSVGPMRPKMYNKRTESVGAYSFITLKCLSRCMFLHFCDIFLDTLTKVRRNPLSLHYRNTKYI